MQKEHANHCQGSQFQHYEDQKYEDDKDIISQFGAKPLGATLPF